MSDQTAILKAVLDDPADDLPRLAYADWLEEHGEDAHAEFIRVQIEAESGAFREKLSGSYREIGKAIEGKFARAKQLLMTGNVTQWFNLSWSQPCQLIIKSGDKILLQPWHYRQMELVVRRGFVREVSCYPKDWRENGAAIVALQPITKVDLSQAIMKIRGTRNRWFAHRSGLLPMADYCPAGTFDQENQATVFDNLAEFKSTLSEACLAYAKAQLAGRQPLPT